MSVYEHKTTWKGKRELSGVFYDVFTLLLCICFAVYVLWYRPHDYKNIFCLFSWHSNVNFSLEEIRSACLADLNTIETQKFVTPRSWGWGLKHTNTRLLYGPYQYAFFLKDRQPLPDGHQAVELKLRNGRHVLIETDDAENFIAALKKSGVGVGC